MYYYFIYYFITHELKLYLIEVVEYGHLRVDSFGKTCTSFRKKKFVSEKSVMEMFVYLYHMFWCRSVLLSVA